MSDKIYCYCDSTYYTVSKQVQVGLNVRLMKMFVSKVHDQKLELLRAVFRNMYLKEKCDYLDSECKMLTEHIVSSQLVRAEKNETILKLKKDLSGLRQIHEEKLEELARNNEQIMSMSLTLQDTKCEVLSSLDQDKSIDNDLDLKNEMIKCLQEELVQARLEAAEKWVEIRDLQKTKTNLEQEKELLLLKKPETVSRLQEELITTKLLETQYNNDFENIREQLAHMKHELKELKEKDQALKSGKEEGSIQLYKNKGAFWNSSSSGSSKLVEEERVENIERLKSEKIYLENKIPELQSKINIINKHLRLKEEEKCRFQDKLTEEKLKHRSIENVILERKRQCDYLEKTAAEKVTEICKSCSDKEKNIEELSLKLHTLSERRLSKMLQTVKEEELNTIGDLEKRILALQERKEELNSEIVKAGYIMR